MLTILVATFFSEHSNYTCS